MLKIRIEDQHVKKSYIGGASLKDLGKRWFDFSKINLNPSDLLNRLI
jgi:hypothetical protein